MKTTENIHFKRGLELLNANQVDKALASFERGLELDPSHTLCRYNRGVCLMKLEKYALAMIDLNLVVEKEPKNATFICERALVRYFTGDGKGAMKDLDLAVKLDPDYAYRYAIRGFIKDKLGDTEGGIKDYYKAVELDPEDAVAFNNLGLLEEKMGYKQHAQKKFKIADSLAVKQESASEFTTITTFEELFTETPVEQPQRKATWKDYLKVISNVFTTKKGLSEFWGFIKSVFK